MPDEASASSGADCMAICGTFTSFCHKQKACEPIAARMGQRNEPLIGVKNTQQTEGFRDFWISFETAFGRHRPPGPAERVELLAPRG